MDFVKSANISLFLLILSENKTNKKIFYLIIIIIAAVNLCPYKKNPDLQEPVKIAFNIVFHDASGTN